MASPDDPPDHEIAHRADQSGDKNEDCQRQQNVRRSEKRGTYPGKENDDENEEADKCNDRLDKVRAVPRAVSSMPTAVHKFQSQTTFKHRPCRSDCYAFPPTAESNIKPPHIKPRPESQLGKFAKVGATSASRANVELWRGLAALGLVVLLFEWWYHKRTA